MAQEGILQAAVALAVFVHDSKLRLPQNPRLLNRVIVKKLKLNCHTSETIAFGVYFHIMATKIKFLDNNPVKRRTSMPAVKPRFSKHKSRFGIAVPSHWGAKAFPKAG